MAAEREVGMVREALHYGIILSPMDYTSDSSLSNMNGYSWKYIYMEA